jgi:hypothetical protein
MADQDEEDIRRQNRALEQLLGERQEANLGAARRMLEERLPIDQIIQATGLSREEIENLDDNMLELSNDFFMFNPGRDQQSQQDYVILHSDEMEILEWCAFIREVSDWFRSLLEPAEFATQPGQTVHRPGIFPYTNQIQNMDRVNELYSEAIRLKMNTTSLYKDFLGIPHNIPIGTFRRLEKIIQMRDEVLKNHKWCLSTIKTFVWKQIQKLPKVKKGDTCFINLQKSIDDLISTGLFLRKYRNDLKPRDIDTAIGDAIPNRIINFENEDERQDYLNVNLSVFVEPELNKAEVYLLTLVLERDRAELESVRERQEREEQDAGRFLKSKKNKKITKISKRK